MLPDWGWSSLPLQHRDRYGRDRKSTRLNSSHLVISYAVFCLKKKTENLYAEPSLYFYNRCVNLYPAFPDVSTYLTIKTLQLSELIRYIAAAQRIVFLVTIQTL